MERLPQPPGITEGLISAWGVSEDGQTVLMTTDSSSDRQRSWILLGSAITALTTPGADSVWAWDLSSDGRVAVGTMRVDGIEEGFRWTAETGLVGLGSVDGEPPSGNSLSTAEGVSDDGDVIAGRASQPTNTFTAARWTAKTGFVPLTSDSTIMQALAVSRNGQAVVGSFNSSAIRFAFLWTPENGIVQLPSLPDDTENHYSAWAVSDDGAIVAGWKIFGVPTAEAIVWDSVRGAIRLRTLLERDFGLDLEGWQIYSVYDMTSDGTTMVGYAEDPTGLRQAYRAYVPRLQHGDMNCDGVTGVGDINAFVLALTDANGYAQQFPDCRIIHGDCTGDGSVGVSDINCFIKLVTAE